MLLESMRSDGPLWVHNTVHAEDVDDAFRKTCVLFSRMQESVSPRGMATKELLDYKIVIKHPDRCVIMNQERKLSYRYLAAEMLWYLSGDLSITKIKEYSSMWGMVADDGGNVNSNYGHIVFFQELENFAGLNQFDWCVRSLREDKDSRQAVINFNQPAHKNTHTRDFVCTTSLQFMIRNNKLYMFVHIRSNDLVYGFSYDAPFFCFLHQLMYHRLRSAYGDLELGSYVHDAASMHIYAKHYDMVSKVALSVPVASGNFKGIDDSQLYKALIQKDYDGVLFFDCLSLMRKLQ